MLAKSGVNTYLTSALKQLQYKTVTILLCIKQCTICYYSYFKISSWFMPQILNARTYFSLNDDFGDTKCQKLIFVLY